MLRKRRIRVATILLQHPGEPIRHLSTKDDLNKNQTQLISQISLTNTVRLHFLHKTT